MEKWFTKDFEVENKNPWKKLCENGEPPCPSSRIPAAASAWSPISLSALRQRRKGTKSRTSMDVQCLAPWLKFLIMGSITELKMERQVQVRRNSSQQAAPFNLNTCGAWRWI
uniref:Uncharacterized protein n=1 Tax=Fagus sylvatica TaxID=28930 RepID=A0A2N9GQQ6_FAGSY